MLRFSTLVLALGLFAPAFAWPQPPTVNLGYAVYQGSYNSTADITYFLGVRYANPPTGKRTFLLLTKRLLHHAGLVGENRFQAPQAPSTVRGTIVADYPPPQCPQGAQGVSATQPWNVSSVAKRQSGLTEDCLFLK